MANKEELSLLETKKGFTKYIVMATVVILVVTTAVSYSLWQINHKGEETQRISSGCFEMEFVEKTNSVNLTNSYPMTNAQGNKTDPYTFSIKNDCSIYGEYYILLDIVDSKTTIDLSKVKISLEGAKEVEPSIINTLPQNAEEMDSGIRSSYILASDDAEVSGEEKEYSFRMWIDEAAGNEVMNQSAEVRISIISVAVKKQNEEEVVESSYDVTDTIISLGKPFTKSNYANNVWDMQVFDGKIYLAHGDWQNNAGPIPIISLNPSTKTYATEISATEESIEKFTVLNGKLYTPGADSRDGGDEWRYGNFYVLEAGGTWEKRRTIDYALHVFDMTYYNGKLYAVIGTDPSNVNSYGIREIQESSDGGLTWTARMPVPSDYVCRNRCTSLFEINGKLYAANTLTSQITFDGIGIIEIGDTVSNKTFTGIDFLKGALPRTSDNRMERQGNFKGKLLFILYGATSTSADYFYPKHMFIETSLTEPGQLVTFPETNALAIDILYREEKVYVLTHIKNSSTSYTNIVYESSDLSTWREVFRFNRDTFARSFEEINGDFYFGLGSLSNDVKTSTGQILEVKKSFYPVS